jgi:hypothetical protein
MFQRLFAKLVSGQVISLGVGSGCGFMGVGGNVVHLCGSIVCTLWHGGLLYSVVIHRECSSEEPFGKPPTALAGQAYTGISFFSSESPGLYQS